MKTIIKEIDVEINYPIEKLGKIEDVIFFDIETTGFSAASTCVYLIGCVYNENGKWISCQWLGENTNDEPMILNSFFKNLSRFKTVIHYNGQGFDIPYLETKCRKYMLPYTFADYNSIDIYREILGLKDFFKVDNLKQKTIEAFLGVNRNDQFNGGELINIYYEYEKTNSQELEQIILLHNAEDIAGMLSVLGILAYSDIFKGNYSFENIEIIANPELEVIYNKIAIFNIILDTPVEKRISFGYGPFYFSCLNNKLVLKIKVYTDELKFFYPNYKDYYYLPMEDTSIHKSVAFYVDKDFKTKAKAANCYSKKTGQFLPQYSDIVSPYFKIDYNDKIKYFEMTSDFLHNNELIKSYTSHILNTMKTKKKIKN